MRAANVRMLTELRNNVRRKKMEVRHRAVAIVEQCVLIEDGRLMVKGGNAELTRKDEFDIGDLSTPRNDEEKVPSPLSDAYQVLTLFAESTGGRGSLDCAMKSVADNLFKGIFEPMFRKLQDMLNNEQLGQYYFDQDAMKSVPA